MSSYDRLQELLKQASALIQTASREAGLLGTESPGRPGTDPHHLLPGSVEGGDALRERYYELSRDHRATELQLRQLEGEVEFALRHIESSWHGDEELKHVVLTRLRTALAALRREA